MVRKMSSIRKVKNRIRNYANLATTATETRLQEFWSNNAIWENQRLLERAINKRKNKKQFKKANHK